MLFATFTLLFATTQSFSSTAQKQFKKIELMTGDSQKLSVLNHTGPELNRMGIVDLTFTDQKSWLATALKPGTVIARWINEDGSIIKRIFIVRNQTRTEKKFSLNGSHRKSVYRFQIKITLLKNGNDKIKGSKFDQPKLFLKQGLASLNPFIELDHRKFNQSVLAEPRGQVITGEHLKIHSGGEIFFETKSKEAEGVWKPFGIQIDIKPIHSIGSNKILCEVGLKISGKSERTSSEGVGIHELKSHTILKLDHETLLGNSQLNRKHRATHTHSILESIPIIAPLFKIRKNETSENHVLFWLTASRVNI